MLRINIRYTHTQYRSCTKKTAALNRIQSILAAAVQNTLDAAASAVPDAGWGSSDRGRMDSSRGPGALQAYIDWPAMDR
uniref:Uncharacterized protein n=1 Tax=Arundo donax TaxID=35708 RepID=A0A0A9I185_ARUDO